MKGQIIGSYECWGAQTAQKHDAVIHAYLCSL